MPWSIYLESCSGALTKHQLDFDQQNLRHYTSLVIVKNFGYALQTPNLVPFVSKVVMPRSTAGALTIHCINVSNYGRYQVSMVAIAIV